MPENRYFIDSTLEKETEVPLPEKEGHHLLRVMRKKVGEKCELVNGQGALASATITQINKKQVFLYLDKVIQSSAPKHHIILAQALPRINRLDVIVEKGTELGMDALWLFPAERSEKKTLSSNQKNRLHHLAIAAMKQSGRLFLPEIKLFPSLLSWKKNELPPTLFFGDPTPNAPTLFSVWKNRQTLIFFVGPEAGFSPKELNHLQALNATGVSLHPNILRTDTAPLTALSLIYSGLNSRFSI